MRTVIMRKNEGYTNGHSSKKIMFNEVEAEIDKRMVNLILELNKAGLETTQCCQGNIGKDTNDLPYISISTENIEDLAVRQNGKRLTIWWKPKKIKIKEM